MNQLTVCALSQREWARASELLNHQHYLGDCNKGRQLLVIIEFQGQWVALLGWGPCTHKLADQDEYIGWTAQQRAARMGLVVQNRRFLVLGSKRLPNLASRALKLATAALPEHSKDLYGYSRLWALGSWSLGRM